MGPSPLVAVLDRALRRRSELVHALHAEGTDCYRLLQGAAEGAPGITIDRYGPVLLVQTWRAPLQASDVDALARTVSKTLNDPVVPVLRHRGGEEATPGGDATMGPDDAVGSDTDGRTQTGPLDTSATDHSGAPDVPDALLHPIGHEFGISYDVRPYHRGQDPLLFIDLRAGRRRVRAESSGASVLNLFAYTCGVGLTAAVGGAREVVNVDVASSALDVGMRNAERNGVPRSVFKTLREDAIPVVRQFADLSVRGRGARRRSFVTLAPRQFDIVVLDPPRWAKGPFGAVDVVRDYPSLFKPVVLATRPGGRVLATNHVPHVPLDAWLDVLTRCANKAGRPLDDIEVIPPEADVPSFDNRPPLKMAWVTVGG